MDKEKIKQELLNLVLELIKTDKTIAKVCEEKKIIPTDYPELYELTDAIENRDKIKNTELLSEIEKIMDTQELPYKEDEDTVVLIIKKEDWEELKARSAEKEVVEVDTVVYT